MEGVRAKGILATSVGLAELFDSGTGLVVLFLATVLAFVLGLVIVLSSTVLFERLTQLIRIVRGQEQAAEATKTTKDDEHEDPPGEEEGWSRSLRRRIARRMMADRS
jgi:hypothetical protein